jgi:HSP20 family protein
MVLPARRKNPVKATLFKSKKGNSFTRIKRATRVPAANVDETAFEYLLSIAIPGCDKQSISIKVENEILIIKGSKPPVNENCIHDRCEYDYSKWERAFLLPDDGIGFLTKAVYKNGELLITVPKGKKENTILTLPIYVY